MQTGFIYSTNDPLNRSRLFKKVFYLIVQIKLDAGSKSVMATRHDSGLLLLPAWHRPILSPLVAATEDRCQSAFNSAGPVQYEDFLRASGSQIDLRTGRLVLQTTETLAEGWPAGTCCTVDFTLLPEELVMTAFAW